MKRKKVIGQYWDIDDHKFVQGQKMKRMGLVKNEGIAEFSPEEKEAMQIKDTMMRLSVGIEDIEDLISDIDEALNKSRI